MSLIERAVNKLDTGPSRAEPPSRDPADLRADPVLSHAPERMESAVADDARQQREPSFAMPPASHQPLASPGAEMVLDPPMAEPAVQRSGDAHGASLGSGPSEPADVAARAAAEVRRIAQSRQVRIDTDRLMALGMVTPEAPKTTLAEEFRMIKRPLLNQAFGTAVRKPRSNLIMVTSAFPKEGKTFTAVNLAVSIAMETDRRVLLVDADVARPSVPDQLGIDLHPGLMDVLVDGIDVGDAILRTNIDKLTILQAGRSHHHATELLASESMFKLLNELSTRYADRIVVFDSPPLLVTTESRALAANMGQIVLVVEAERTSHDSVKEAVAAVEQCDVVGMVLNKTSRAAPGESYGYYGY